MALKASPVAGLFPPLRPTASSSPSTSNRPCSLRVLPARPSFFGNSIAPQTAKAQRLQRLGSRLKLSPPAPCLALRYLKHSHGVKKHYRLDINEQTWKRRMKIAQDIATALAYLHTAFPRPFVYRSFSHMNILLDEDGVAKLIDFSHCVSIPEGETFVRVDRAQGLYSYLDDDYMSRDGGVSEKTDVFAFGMFMGRRLLLGNKRILKHYDRPLLSQLKDDQRMEEIADPKMIEKMGHISEKERCQMKAFLMLSQRCICPREEVPTMVEVAKELKKIQTSLINDSSSPSGETQFDSTQDISSSLVPSNPM